MIALGEEIEYTAEEIAQQLANALGVNVLAPTEAVWVNRYGETFVSDHDGVCIHYQ